MGEPKSPMQPLFSEEQQKGRPHFSKTQPGVQVRLELRVSFGSPGGRQKLRILRSSQSVADEAEVDRFLVRSAAQGYSVSFPTRRTAEKSCRCCQRVKTRQQFAPRQWARAEPVCRACAHEIQVSQQEAKRAAMLAAIASFRPPVPRPAAVIALQAECRDVLVPVSHDVMPAASVAVQTDDGGMVADTALGSGSHGSSYEVAVRGWYTVNVRKGPGKEFPVTTAHEGKALLRPYEFVREHSKSVSTWIRITPQGEDPAWVLRDQYEYKQAERCEHLKILR